MLERAFTLNDPQSFELLCKQGASITAVDSLGQTYVHRSASRSGQTFEQFLKLALDYKVDVNQQDNDQQTALHLACFGLIPSHVETLLAHGIDASLKNYDGNTALDMATWAMNYEESKGKPSEHLPELRERYQRIQSLFERHA